MDLNVHNVYIFIYSIVGEAEQFDMRLSPATPTNINHALLKARLNSQRKPTVYAIKLSEKEHQIFQEEWVREDLSSRDLFQQLKELGITEIPW